MNIHQKQHDNSLRLGEKYLDIRNFLVYQQAVFIALLNVNYEFVISKPIKRSLITSQLLKIIQISKGSASINVIDFIETRCNEKFNKDLSLGFNQSTTYRRYTTNKHAEKHHLLIDMLFESGFTFKSTYSSGKNKSTKLETVEEVYYQQKRLLTKEEIITKGKKIGEYLQDRIKAEKECYLIEKDPKLQQLLDIV
ncbi:TATA-binding protein-associated phosphoprotein [Entamoeba marina]